MSLNLKQNQDSKQVPRTLFQYLAKKALAKDPVCKANAKTKDLDSKVQAKVEE